MGSDWIKNIKKGDVLESGAGLLRIVRDVSHHKRTSVTFAIRRPSWTTRPYTVMGESDLRTLGYRPVECKPFPLRTDFDKALEQSFHAPTAESCLLRARDVMGVA
jgi:hypothetical protein